MIRPKTENLDVIVNVSDTESWDQHVQKLNKFLERECGAGDMVYAGPRAGHWGHWKQNIRPVLSLPHLLSLQ